MKFFINLLQMDFKLVNDKCYKERLQLNDNIFYDLYSIYVY